MGFLDRCPPGTMTQQPPGTTTGQVLPIPLPVTTEPKTAVTGFDTAQPGVPLRYPLERVGLSQQSITFSTATFGRSTDYSYNTTGSATAFGQLMTDPDRIVSDMTTGFIQHLGNDTQYTQAASIVSPVTGVLRQLQFYFAVGLNVSAYSAGSFRINSVSLSLQSFMSPAVPSPFNAAANFTILPNAAFTALTATGTHVFVCKGTIDAYYRTFRGQPLIANLTVNETTGTGTRQVGLIPLFPLYADAGNRTVYESQLSAWFQALPDQAQDLKGQSAWELTGLEGI